MDWSYIETSGVMPGLPTGATESDLNSWIADIRNRISQLEVELNAAIASRDTYVARLSEAVASTPAEQLVSEAETGITATGQPGTPVSTIIPETQVSSELAQSVQTQIAGFGSWGMLLLGGAAVFMLFGKKKGRK